VKLIDSGFSIYSRFGDLTPDRLVELFCFFRSLPDYDSCAFKDAMALSHDAISFPFSLADVSVEKPRPVGVQGSALVPVVAAVEHEGEHLDDHAHEEDAHVDDPTELTRVRD
jgi:hypothetical protein